MMTASTNITEISGIGCDAAAWVSGTRSRGNKLSSLTGLEVSEECIREHLPTATQYHILGDRNPWLHRSENLTTCTGPKLVFSLEANQLPALTKLSRFEEFKFHVNDCRTITAGLVATVSLAENRNRL
jgi:hypothetical protein